MKVLAATPLYPPKSRVGAWLATHQYLRWMAERGHNVTALAMNEVGQGWELDGVQVLTGARGKTQMVELAKGADVLISHFGDGGRGRTISRRAGVPSVQIVHGHLHREPASADLIVYNSKATADRTIKGDGSSIICHPPTIAAEHRVDQTGEHITLVNCSRDKGIMTAWGLADALPDRQFLGVRGGYGSQDHLPRTANWTTWPTQLDMRTVWAETRILLMPSAFETWGMVGVEAMCSGIPVIAHPTPGLRESLGGAGIFCDRDDIASWVAEVRRLDDPYEYEVASKAARARADELDPTPDLDRFADAVEALCS